MMTKPIGVQRAAHHEAGHVVVAARKSIPIRWSGMCIDDVDKGCSEIMLRGPEFSDSYPVSREDSIIVLCAGILSERRFNPETTGNSAACDIARMRELLSEIKSPAQQAELEIASKCLVTENGHAIDRLADALLNKNFQVSPVSLYWTTSRNIACLCGDEIREILGGLGIPVTLSGGAMLAE